MVSITATRITFGSTLLLIAAFVPQAHGLPWLAILAFGIPSSWTILDVAPTFSNFETLPTRAQEHMVSWED